MKITELKINQFIKIKGKEYEIIKIEKEVTFHPPKYRDILSFSLFKKGSKKITPTHYLIYFFDNRKIKIIDEINEEEKEIKDNEIKIISL